ncbi:restriction endonuclease subunit S [Mycoplasmopsis lipophila]|uniref:restriction endonuclease subunit S n=1 Tax=Mycoplasmopsis lipophila TaxID=2117 RepID=UPI0038732198
MKDVCTISRGKAYTKSYIKEHKGEYPLYSSQTLNNGELGKINTYDYDGEYVTWTTDGIYAGTTFYRKGKFSITTHCGILNSNNSNLLLNKFLYFLLSTNRIKNIDKNQTIPMFTTTLMEQIEIPIPSLEVQQKIVNILDKLENYSKDIKTGLPLEIEQRQKQYEYYRNMLLDFEKFRGGI